MNLKDDYLTQIEANWSEIKHYQRDLSRLRTELLASDQYCKSKESKEEHLTKIKRATDAIIRLLNRQTFLLSGYLNTYEPVVPMPSLIDAFKDIFNPSANEKL